MTDVLKKWKPSKDNPICRCAGGFVCVICELTNEIEAERIRSARHIAAIKYAQEIEDHFARLAFLQAYELDDEIALLEWPEWLAARERVTKQVEQGSDDEAQKA